MMTMLRQQKITPTFKIKSSGRDGRGQFHCFGLLGGFASKLCASKKRKGKGVNPKHGETAFVG
jgi:hypothetical protein